jgi:hypothetical protein
VQIAQDLHSSVQPENMSLRAVEWTFKLCGRMKKAKCTGD